MKRSLSTARLRTSPRNIFPPALRHLGNSLAAPILSFRLSLARNVEDWSRPDPRFHVNEQIELNSFSLSATRTRFRTERSTDTSPC